MKIEDLYVVYGALQGQVAAITNVCAALAAKHLDKELLERVLTTTQQSEGYKRDGGKAEEGYAIGMAHACAVFRAAMAGLNSSPGEPS
jgi:hypothetical protein